MSKNQSKVWFAIFCGSVPLGIVHGEKKSAAALVKYRGSIRRGFRTLRAALKALKNGPDWNGDEPPPLF